MASYLRHQEKAIPGRLRIYLGYAPGAGTTCALLREGQQRAGCGDDVAVARVQARGRPHTQTLLAVLEIIPGAAVAYPAAVAAEMNLGAVLARRPEVALVDELADRRSSAAHAASTCTPSPAQRQPSASCLRGVNPTREGERR